VHLHVATTVQMFCICYSGHAGSFVESRRSSVLHSAAAAAEQSHCVITSDHHFLSPHHPVHHAVLPSCNATTNDLPTPINNFVVRIALTPSHDAVY